MLTLIMTFLVYIKFMPNVVLYVPSLMLIARRERQVEVPGPVLEFVQVTDKS